MTKRKKKQSYVPAPQIPGEVQQRYEVILQVLAGELSVSEGARRLDLSRLRFQTLMHRAMEGLLDGVSPHLPGRPRRPEEVQALMDERDSLQRQNDQLRDQVESSERMMGIVTDVLRGRVRPMARASKSQTKRRPKDAKTEETDDDQRLRFHAAEEMLAMGVTREIAAARVGRSASTLRRWQRRSRHGRPLARRRGPGHRVPALVWVRRVSEHVRALRGQVSAAALGRMTGASRRQALAIKRAELVAMERERKQAAWRVVVTEPGVVRGFDAMHVRTTIDRRHVFVAADASVPFRTSIEPAEHYDGHAVAEVLEVDIEEHGAPLCYRMDRARCHTSPPVNAVLQRHQVLLLHGPPHHPGYYGQLERQNREHRGWLRTVGEPDPEQLNDELRQMKHAFNNLLPRRMLGWRTPRETWDERRELAQDRVLLHHEVHQRAARLRDHMDLRGRPADLPERLAIEQALIQRGYLHIQHGGHC